MNTIRDLLAKLRAANRRRLKRRSDRRGLSYELWRARYCVPDESSQRLIAQQAERLDAGPLISILLPVFNPEPAWLAATIDSVREQIYPRWQLCIADDASTDPRIRTIIEGAMRDDRRIVAAWRETNGHICAASNTALSLAEGDFVALLDHDDLLSPQALLWVATAVVEQPDAALIYSDEDKIAADGGLVGPHFKPDMNLELLRSCNYITHLCVLNRSLVTALGGFRIGLEGAQDHDLVLRLIEVAEKARILHVPKVLYHWRVHEGSTARSVDVKPYATAAGRRAIQEHLARCGEAGSVTVTREGWYHVKYELPSAQPSVTIIIPTRNGLALLRRCIESVMKRTAYDNFDILIVDNGSDDPGTLRYLASFAQGGRVRVIRDDSPFNFSRLNNRAAHETSAEVLCLLNNDIEVISADWLREMVSLAVKPDVGAVGARLWYPDDTLQHGGVILGVGEVAGHAHKRLLRGSVGYFGRAALRHELSAVTAACLVVRRAAYLQVGGLDEGELAVAFNDVDFCLKLRAHGLRNVWTPHADLYHHESASRGSDFTSANRPRYEREVLAMQRRWGALLRNDPAYNPNLSLNDEQFRLAQPPRVAPATC